jgi:glycosyltransferase involved in cell wall biosynthesis
MGEMFEKYKQLAWTLQDTGIKNLVFDEDLTKESITALSMMYHETENIKYKYLLREMIMNPTVDIAAKVHIFSQFLVFEFVYDPEKKMHLEKIYKKLVKEVLAKSKVKKYSPLTNNEKNNKRIVCLTTQFLDLTHSPTKVLLNFIKNLEDEFEQIEEVYIFNSNEQPTLGSKHTYVGGAVHNYIDVTEEVLAKKCGLANINRLIIGYEDSSNPEFDIETIQIFAQKIYELRPAYVFSLGGTCFLAEMCNQFIDVVTLQLGIGLPMSCTHYLTECKDVKKVRKYWLNAKQEVIEYPKGWDRVDLPSKVKFERIHKDLPSDKFLICIIGNRLKQEITTDACKFFEKLLLSYSQVDIVFIGKFDEENLEESIVQKYPSRMHYMGAQKELVSVIPLMDLVFNPKRQGGGFSALITMAVGVPVISIDYGDVAWYLESDFKCKDYEEAFEKIAYLMQNPLAYQEAKVKIEACYEAHIGRGTKDLLHYLLDENPEK